MRVKELTIKYDVCANEFEADIKVRQQGDLEITYVVCPKCNKEHILMVTDEKLRRLQDIARLAMLKTRTTVGKGKIHEKNFKMWQKAKHEAEKYAKGAKLKESVG